MTRDKGSEIGRLRTIPATTCGSVPRGVQWEVVAGHRHAVQLEVRRPDREDPHDRRLRRSHTDEVEPLHLIHLASVADRSPAGLSLARQLSSPSSKGQDLGDPVADLAPARARTSPSGSSSPPIPTARAPAESHSCTAAGEMPPVGMT